MANPTFLSMVNEVLVRLREDEVGDVNQTAYSKLIGAFINKTKREVEDSWNWAALRQTYEMITGTGIYNYTLNGSTTRFRIHSAWNTTDDVEMEFLPSNKFDELFRVSRIQGSPRYYSWNGVSLNGDTQVDIWPIPDGPYEVEFQCTVPQEDLQLSADEMLIPKHPVVEGALAHALTERGEDGGTASTVQWQVYRQVLSDFIALESNHFPDELTWNLR